MKPTVALLTILVLLAAGRDAMSQSSRAANAPAHETKAAQPAIEFGHEGGNLRPYRWRSTLTDGSRAWKASRH